jgi:hypothetical protein
MTVRFSFALYELDGVTPKTDASPQFLLGPDSNRDYRSRVGARTPPALTPIRDNLYGFTPTEADERAGVAFVIDCGVDALPRFMPGVIFPVGKPFAAFFFTDGLGGVWTGPAPVVGVYSDVAGALRATVPALQALSGGYLFALTPSAADLNAGIVYRVDADPSASPPFFTGSLTVALAVLSTTKQAVLDRFPELVGDPELSEFVWSELLVDVAAEVPVASWLNQDAADRAALWLTAHMVALEKKRQKGGLASATSPGQLQSVTVGPVTKTWAVPQAPDKTATATDEMLSRTEYGREYMRLRSLYCRFKRR